MKRATATALSCVVLGWFYFTHLDDPLARQIAYPFNYKEEVIAAADYTDRQLKEPTINIELGTWYLGHLLKEFNGDQVLALAAYNAGRGHVESWIHENYWNGMVDTIPFPETRSYVKAVLQYQERYEALYGNDN